MSRDTSFTAQLLILGGGYAGPLAAACIVRGAANRDVTRASQRHARTTVISQTSAMAPTLLPMAFKQPPDHKSNGWDAEMLLKCPQRVLRATRRQITAHKLDSASPRSGEDRMPDQPVDPDQQYAETFHGSSSKIQKRKSTGGEHNQQDDRNQQMGPEQKDETPTAGRLAS